MQTLPNIILSSVAPALETRPVLDIVYQQLRDGQIAPAIDYLFEDLSARREEEPETWPAYARGCLSHPVRALLHQDPFTYRAYSKPRGYAGDAVMMDYIYGIGEAPEAARTATPVGRAIFKHLGTQSAAKAVRYRRHLLARLIDRVCASGGSRVLAIAAGHLREVEFSQAAQNRRLEEFVAFDQDEASLGIVARDYGHLGIRTMPGSVRQILAGKSNPGQFDFVYAAGLFDYLSAPVAAALTARMFEMTLPGGSMLIPNFLTGMLDSGYMESFMDWRLIYRNHADMEKLIEALPAGAVADYQIFDDPDDAIAFLLVTKACR